MDVRPGSRVRLVSMASDPDPIEPGSTGTVESVTSGPLGQVGVRWDSGRSLFLLEGIDVFQIIADEQAANPGRIRIPGKVLEGIEAVRGSGLTNMLDLAAVERIAGELGFTESVEWLADPANKKIYFEGVFRGFEREE